MCKMDAAIEGGERKEGREVGIKKGGGREVKGG